MPALLNRMSIRPKRLDRGVHGGRDGRVVPHVGREGEAQGPEAPALLGQAGEIGARAECVAGVGQRPGDVERRDPRAFPGQRHGHGAALAMRGAGDERDLAGEAGHQRAPQDGGLRAPRLVALGAGATRYGSRYSSRSTRSALLNTLVASMMAPKAVSATICSGE